MSAINLAKLPKPDVIEDINYEALNQLWQNGLTDKLPEYDALLESDPAVIEMQVGAYQEMLTRQRINDAARAVMIPFATGADLDVIGANFNVERLTIIAPDLDARPPIEEVTESDADFRRRIQLKWESITTAGSIGSYRFHALSADGRVKDVYVESPNPSEITLHILAVDGVASAELIDKVTQAVQADNVRPLGDRVTVKAAEIIAIDLTARLTFGQGPDGSVALNAAEKAIHALFNPDQPLGYTIALSAVYAALHQPGVLKVVLDGLTDDFTAAAHQALRLNSLTIQGEVL